MTWAKFIENWNVNNSSYINSCKGDIPIVSFVSSYTWSVPEFWYENLLHFKIVWFRVQNVQV